MKVLIISGGTGSKQLKKGLSKYLDINNMYTLVNAYDNGLSTGIVRKVFNGEILGPSDVRKQQFLDYELYRDKIKTDLSEKIFNVLSKRYTFYKDAEYKIKELVSDFPDEIKQAVEVYFKQKLSHKIRYVDFSIANIVYGGLAYINNKSLQKAADIMAEYLNLPKNVIVNSDESLFLCAKTEKSVNIYDEAEIVDWNNPNNRITDIFFIDKYGNEKIPILSERAKKVIKKSDLIIFSSGTQFSSLIPTYKTKGFKEAIKEKEKYLVVNITRDKDMIGYSLEEELKIILKSLNYDVSKIISHTKIYSKLDIPVVINEKIKNKDKHDPDELAFTIFDSYFNFDDFNTLIFDFDDTIFSRNIKDVDVSLENNNLINKLYDKYKIILFTGKKLSEIPKELKCNYYATNYGSTIYKDNKIIYKNFELKTNELNEIFDVLRDISFNVSKIENRNNCIISLRFLDYEYREVLHKYLLIKLPDLQVIKAGISTIDIMKKDNNKYNNFKKLLELIDIDKNKVFYIGDEINGNDKDMIKKLPSLHVKNVYDTNVFLKYLLRKG